MKRCQTYLFQAEMIFKMCDYIGKSSLISETKIHHDFYKLQNHK